MAKLYFRYGAMNSGKSTGLLQAAFNYEERGQRVLLAKPQVDSKGEDQIVSRLGVTRTVDFLIPHGTSVLEIFHQHATGDDPEALLSHVDAEVKPVACLLVDEAQFLSRPRWMTCCALRSWRTCRSWPTASAPTSAPSPSRARAG